MRFLTMLVLLFVSSLAIADTEQPQAQIVIKGANYAFQFDDVEQNGPFESYVCNVYHADLGFRLNTITAEPVSNTNLYECLDQGFMQFGSQYRIDVEHRQWPSERLKTIYTFYATIEY